MKKLLLLLGSILLITGCKVEYDVTINNDLTVLESVNMTGTEEFFSIYNKSSRLNVVNMMLDAGNGDLLKSNSYTYNIINNDNPNVVAEKKYINISEYTSNTIFSKQYFNELNYKNNDGIITIKGVGFKPNDPDDPDRFDIANLNINIKSYYNIVNSNASKKDDENNIYTWNLNRNDEDFSFELSIDTNTKFISNNRKQNTKMIIIILIVTIILWIIFIIYIKINKKND